MNAEFERLLKEACAARIVVRFQETEVSTDGGFYRTLADFSSASFALQALLRDALGEEGENA